MHTCFLFLVYYELLIGTESLSSQGCTTSIHSNWIFFLLSSTGPSVAVGAPGPAPSESGSCVITGAGRGRAEAAPAAELQLVRLSPSLSASTVAHSTLFISTPTTRLPRTPMPLTPLRAHAWARPRMCAPASWCVCVRLRAGAAPRRSATRMWIPLLETANRAAKGPGLPLFRLPITTAHTGPPAVCILK